MAMLSGSRDGGTKKQTLLILIKNNFCCSYMYLPKCDILPEIQL